MKDKNKIGLVLGSGGARALTQIGVLKVLEREKITPDIIVGASMGAFIGGVFAAGMSIDRIEQIAGQTSIKMTAKMLAPSLSKSGVVDTNRVISFLTELGVGGEIEALPVRFAAIATDFISGEEVILKHGALVEAITASVALPVLFKPVYHQQKFLADGGMVNPLPVSVARKLGADRIIAVNVSHSPGISYQKKNEKSKRVKTIKQILNPLGNHLFQQMKKLNGLKQTALTLEDFWQGLDTTEGAPDTPGIFSNMLQAAYILQNRIIQLQLQLEQPDILISPDISTFKMLEFHRAKELVKIGENAAEQALPLILEMIKSRKFIKASGENVEIM